LTLRARITVTFVLLLALALAVTLGIVSAANGQNAEREVGRELDVGASVFRRILDSNRRQLEQAANVLAQDFGFRTAIATGDIETIRSALENHGQRIGAGLVVLTDLDGRPITEANATSIDSAAMTMADASELPGAGGAGIALRHGRAYQVVSVTVRSPLPIARVLMGFELDQPVLNEVEGILGLDITLAVRNGSAWQALGTTLTESLLPAVLGALPPSGSAGRLEQVGDLAVHATELTRQTGGQVAVVAILSRSVSEVRAAFDRLTQVLWVTAVIGLLVTALAGYLLARGITRPLSMLTEAVDRIRRGEYKVAVAIERGDEVGVLARGLRQMREEVDDRDAAIRRLAFEDTLTGLRNRTGFVAAVDQQLAQSAATSIPLYVALINLRRFRTINECLGYAVGDQVLRHVAQRLPGAAGGATIAARLTADQFAVMADSDVIDREQAMVWAQALLARLSRAVNIEGQKIDIAPVVGIAAAPDDATDATELLRCADMAVDLARRRGVGVAAYGPEIPQPGRDQLSLLGELQRAVRENELRIALQPKLDFASGAVAGAEVLLRWQHPVRGAVSPAQFIPFAEQTGFVRHLTQWALVNATRLAAQMQSDGFAVPLSVNISAADLADPRLDSKVAQALADAGIPPDALTLEVTESGFIDNPREALAMLEALRAVGVRLSIDDFGTGYSSLSYLAHMPVDELKIDQSFVRRLHEDPALVAVVGSAIDMGHRLGLSVVAEGVETAAHAEKLRALGCDIGQGYLFAKPMPPDAFIEWLRGRDILRKPTRRAAPGAAATAAAASAESAQHLERHALG
jgi:diguanylate cyclase (GGDEF)-like protein